jgi:hypothetical protein
VIWSLGELDDSYVVEEALRLFKSPYVRRSRDVPGR